MLTYLSNRVHLEELWGFVSDTHLKIGDIDLHTSVLCGNECLLSTFVSLVCVQHLQSSGNKTDQPNSSLLRYIHHNRLFSQPKLNSSYNQLIYNFIQIVTQNNHSPNSINNKNNG